MKKQRTLTRLLSVIGAYKWLLIAVILLALCSNIALLIVPDLIGQAIDLMLPFDNPFLPQLIQKCGLILLLYLSGCVFQYLTSLCAAQVANRTVQQLRTALFAKLQRLPVKYFDTHSRGDMISRFSADVDAIADGLNQGIVQLISGMLAILISLGFMLMLNPAVALVSVFVTPLCFLAGFFITRYGNRRFREQSRVLGALNGCAEEMISAQQTVSAFEYEAGAQKRFDALNGELYECGYRAQFASALVNPSTRFVNNVAYILVGVCGIFAGLSTGMIASFLTYTAQFSKPFNEITSITMQLQLALAAACRVFEVLDEPESTPDKESDFIPAQYEIRFEHVAFSYTQKRPLIRDFSLTVAPGTTVAIVGPTGSGKTTLVNLLMRFYETNSGRITLGGTDIRDIPRDDLRRCFGMVLQETWLFEGIVRDNIAYGCPNATEEQIVAAAKAAHAHNFIRRLPQGYDTPIAEGSDNLSAGQKQLLTIARTMLLDAPMLILDEATSSVDILTEQRTQKAFRKMMHGKTSFIIAHRLSTIRDADIILVLNDGDIVEQGTHDELLKKGGFYHKLYNAQFAQTV